MDQQFHRDYHATYTVIVTDPVESDLAILTSGYVPLPNSPHWADPEALAKKPEVSIPDKEDPTLRLVTVEWSTKAQDPERQNQDHTESPLLSPPTVRWGHVVSKVLLTETSDGESVKKVVNGLVTGNATIPGAVANKPTPVHTSAGEPFDPSPETEERHLTLLVTRPQLTYSAFDSFNYLDHTNDADFQGFDPGRARCTQFDGERAWSKGIAFWMVTLGFEFADNWDVDLRDYGTYSITDDGQYRKIPAVLPNGAGNRINLDGEGNALDPNDPTVYLRFRQFPRADFSLLELDNL